MPADQSGDSSQISYTFTDLSQIEADVAAMETFAAGLAANVENSYVPNMGLVSAAMTTEIPPPPVDFVELHTFLFAHREAQDVTQQNVFNYANGTSRFAIAASEISKMYSGSDAFSHAEVTDVDKAFGAVGIPKSTDPGGHHHPKPTNEEVL